MLPKLDVPIYELKLPLLDKIVRYRPFLVKEEKLLLMAMESNDEKSVVDAVKQIVNNCCIDEIDVDNLPIVDLEFLFLNLRARSVGEVVELQYKCNNKVKKEDSEEEKTCGTIVKFNLNLLELNPVIDEKHSNKIELSADTGIVMKYPNFKLVEKIDAESEVDRIMKMIVECVDFIYDKDNIYYRKDIEEKELQEFIESLTRDQFKNVQTFFETLPKIKKNLHFQCSKCKYEEDFDVEGLQNFFV